MPFSKETFAPKNYQNLLLFGQNFNLKANVANFSKNQKSALEIRQILEKEVLPLVKKWNNYELSPDYRRQIILSGSFLILNCLVSVFYLMMIFSLIYLIWFIFTDNLFAKIEKFPSTYYFIIFILVLNLILILLFPKLPSTRAIYRYFKVHKNLFFYNFGDNFKAEIINKSLFDYPKFFIQTVTLLHGKILKKVDFLGISGISTLRIKSAKSKKLNLISKLQKLT